MATGARPGRPGGSKKACYDCDRIMQVCGEKIGSVFTQLVDAEAGYEEPTSGEFDRAEVSKRVFRTIKGVFNVLDSHPEYIYEIESLFAKLAEEESSWEPDYEANLRDLNVPQSYDPTRGC